MRDGRSLAGENHFCMTRGRVGQAGALASENGMPTGGNCGTSTGGHTTARRPSYSPAEDSRE
jgi:hypothetical protein